MNQTVSKLKEFWEEKFPDTTTFLWSPEEAFKIPDEHKDQIHFINEEGKAFLSNLYKSAKIGFVYGMNKKERHPFNRAYFNIIEKFEGDWNNDKEIKKWLYNRGIPFSKYVIIASDRSGNPVMLTWKMVIKYWKGIFWEDDITISDTSFEWCLFYYHESEFYFAKDVILDREEEANKTIALNRDIQEWKDKMQ